MTPAPEQLSFLPPTPFAPAWPAPHTLADRALSQLMAGQTLDHPAFEGTTRSWRLAAVVFQLRSLGWPIEAIDVPAPTAEAPTRYIARYTLAPRWAAAALAANGGADD